jgi:uncharacterized protein YndB with AHSA1/START domain
MEIRIDRLMAVAPARVMQALLDPRELTRWACTEAQVNEQTWRLSGNVIPGQVMGGRLLDKASHRLQVEWVLKGEPSVFTITLAAVPQEGNPPAVFTRVEVEHVGVPAGAVENADSDLGRCVWGLMLHNLRGWVERAEVSGLFDYSSDTPKLVERSLVMEATPSLVWRTLTEPDLRRRWFHEPLGAELRREEGRLVTYEWLDREMTTQVTFTLEPLGGDRTRVVITHVGLPGAVVDYHVGWHGYLVALRLETARPKMGQTVWIAARPDQVWRFVSSEEGLRLWFNHEMTFEPVVGGQVYFEAHGDGLRGKVLVYEPNSRLAFSWTEVGAGWPEPEPLLLTMALAQEDGGTRLTLTHEGFEHLAPERWVREFGSYQRGWSRGAGLNEVRDLVEAAS